MPKTCDDCRAENEHAEDPSQCSFGECPRRRFERHPAFRRLVPIYQFAMLALASWEEKDEFSGEKTRHYGIEQTLQQFMAACKIKRVREQDYERALDWVAIVAKAANEAPDAAITALLAKRRNGGR